MFFFFIFFFVFIGTFTSCLSPYVTNTLIRMPLIVTAFLTTLYFLLPLFCGSVNTNKIAISLQFLTFWVLYFVSSINFFPILFHAWLQVTSILGPIPRSPFHTGKFFEDLSQFIGHHNSGKFKFKMIQM